MSNFAHSRCQLVCKQACSEILRALLVSARLRADLSRAEPALPGEDQGCELEQIGTVTMEKHGIVSIKPLPEVRRCFGKKELRSAQLVGAQLPIRLAKFAVRSFVKMPCKRRLRRLRLSRTARFKRVGEGSQRDLGWPHSLRKDTGKVATPTASVLLLRAAHPQQI